MRRIAKQRFSRILVVAVVAITMAFPSFAFGSVANLGYDTTAPGKDLAGSEYADKAVDYHISLSTQEDYESTAIEISTSASDTKLQKALEEGTLKLSLDRDDSMKYLDPEKFPNMKDPGALENWKTQNSTDLFEVEGLAAAGGKITFNLKNFCYFYSRGKVDHSVPHTNGGGWFDICGYFDLNASIEGKSVGSVKVKVVPYYSYRTLHELYDDIYAVGSKEGKTTKNGLYAKVESLGQTTVEKYDMPYLIIAKDQQSVDEWLAYTDEVENDPAAVLAKLNDPNDHTYDDLKVPVVASNCHPNENSATNGIIEFAEAVTENDSISLKTLESFTEEGAKMMAEERESYNSKVPELISGFATSLGHLRGNENGLSEPLDLEKYYNTETKDVVLSDLMEDVFLIVIPTMNQEGYENQTRSPDSGYDPNRDEANQTLFEDANLQHMVGKYNPMVFTEIHGRVTGCLIEPCTPPHEPNYEYDLIAQQFVELGEALGNGAVANNDYYNSYEMPFRDYLGVNPDSPSGVEWTEPWDDMTTAYGSQFPVLIGTCGITYELPAYNDTTAEKMVVYGMLNQSVYVKEHKKALLKTQAELFKRGVENYNSNEEVAPWYTDQYDQSGTGQAELMRPVYEDNGNFYPEAYLIPMDKDNQVNLLEAAEDLKYLTRNDVKVYRSTGEIIANGKTYPAGTLIVPMYQAKRSLANSQLFDGTFISVWAGLYSESLASRTHARGYDRVTVTKPADYNAIKTRMGDAISYEDALKIVGSLESQFSGDTGADVIIENASEDSSAAVVELLNKGFKVGMITDTKSVDGDEISDQGDFITSYEAYTAVSKKYVLSAQGVKNFAGEAKVIAKSPQVYINDGNPATATTGRANTQVLSGRYNYNFDKIAATAMGLDITTKATKADVIINSSAGGLSTAALQAVADGTPYLGHGNNGITAIKSVLNVTRSTNPNGTDALNVVEYPNVNLTNASYAKEGDEILYEYGAGFFASIPDGAVALVKNAGKDPIQGCICLVTDREKTAYEQFKTAVQAFAYEKEGLDITLFANVLTHKVHQQDDFTYISNFAFSKVLSDTDYANENAPATDEALAAAKENAKQALEATLADIDNSAMTDEEKAAAKAPVEEALKTVESATNIADVVQAATTAASDANKAVAEASKADQEAKALAEAKLAAIDEVLAAAGDSEAAAAAALKAVESIQKAADPAAVQAAAAAAKEAVAKVVEEEKAAADAAKEAAAKAAAAKKYTVKGLKVKSKAKKAIVTFKKTKGATAYQVQYRLKGKKWSNMAKSTKKVKVTSKKLKKGKKYQVRVRTITKVNGKTVYGKWTAAKTVKIK